MSEDYVIDNDFHLLHLVPTVLRARDFRLYTQGKVKGESKQRLVDLWRNGGAAILGHTPPSQLRELKNAASRGLYAPLPHFLEARYLKALARIFPDRHFRLYASPPRELETLMATGNAELWRPFLDPREPLSVSKDAPPVLIPVLPGIQGWRVAKNGHGEKYALPLGFCVLAAKPDLARNLPPSDFISPVLLAVETRGIYDIIAAASGGAINTFPRIAKALRGGNTAWTRRGPYLMPRQPHDTESWSVTFRRFLDAGFLMPPVPFQPPILPSELSPGEEAKLANLLADDSANPDWDNQGNDRN